MAAMKCILFGFKVLCCALALSASGLPLAHAQYPQKPITVVIPYGAGVQAIRSCACWPSR